MARVRVLQPIQYLYVQYSTEYSIRYGMYVAPHPWMFFIHGYLPHPWMSALIRRATPPVTWRGFASNSTNRN